MIPPGDRLTSLVRPWMLIVASILLALPFVALALYTHPGSDDYYNSTWANYWLAQKTLYQTWTGRYFSSLLLTLNPLHWHSLAAYRLCSILIILLLCIAFWQLVVQGLKTLTSATPVQRALVATATIFLLLNDMPSPVETFYWYAGFMTYCSSLILAAFLATIFLKLHQQTDQPIQLRTRLFALLLTIALLGTNEIMMLSCDLACILLIIYYRRKDYSLLQRLYTWLFLVCIVCTAISVLAPGNAARHNQTHGGSLTAISTWVYYSFEHFSSWITEPWILLYSAIVVYTGPRLKSPAKSGLIISFLLPFAVLSLLAFPNIWVMGTPPPGRIKSLLFVCFTIAWLYFLLQLAVRLQIVWQLAPEALQAVKPILHLLVVVVLLLRFDMLSIRGSNYFMIAKAFSQHQPQAFAAEHARRDALLFNPSIKTVALPPLPAGLRRGNLLLYTDVATIPAKFPNPGIAAFHRKAAVYIDTTRTSW